MTRKRNDTNTNPDQVVRKRNVSRNTSLQSTDRDTITKILFKTQTKAQWHAKYIEKLQGLYKKVGHDAFLTVFMSCLKQLIAKEESLAKCANVGLQFMAKFVTSFRSVAKHKFSKSIFNWVLQTISVSANIRLRLCRFVHYLVASLGSNASLENNVCEKIFKYMRERLKDAKATVRVEAIKALQRLQIPDDPDDPIVKIYKFHLSSDPSSKVRKAVLTCLIPNTHTIPVILERLRDVDEDIRRHAYLHMADIPIDSFTVANRLIILEGGFNERSDYVRKAVIGVLLPQWLNSCNQNYIAFLSGLKLDANAVEIDRFQSTSRLALSEIFKSQEPEDLISFLPLGDKDSTYPKCILFDKLTIEASLFWFALIVHFQQVGSDCLEMIFPEMCSFCDYIQKYNSNIINEDKDEREILVSQSILFNLLQILLTFNYGEDVTKQHLQPLVIHLLTTNPCTENIIKSLIHICEKLIPDSDDRLQFYVDILRSFIDQDLLEIALKDPNVIDSLERDASLRAQVTLLKFKISALNEQKTESFEMKDYVNMSQVSEQITLCRNVLVNIVEPLMANSSNFILQNDVTKELSIKVLNLVFQGVCSKSTSKLNFDMYQLYKDFIRDKIESCDMDIRNQALKCGATFSLLYERLAKDVFFALNKQLVEHHHLDIWITSVSGMFQLISRYGFSYFDKDNQNNVSDVPGDLHDVESVTTKTFVHLFSHLMDNCENEHLMSAFIDGFALLILQGIYVDEKIVSRLLLLYFNPTTAEKNVQILQIFFETLIRRKKQECLEEAMIETLTKIIDTSNDSPLHHIQIEDVMRFIIHSTLPKYCGPDKKVHDKLAMSVLEWMNNITLRADLLNIISKQMLTLVISDDNEIRETLQNSVNQLLDNLNSSKAVKNLELFKTQMQGTSITVE